jgi:2-polyprenyl-3-methyl-5-hydroxy-6-metoxy-1,4-benzoquinol methylase
MTDLTRRSTEPELMDDQVASGELSPAEYAHCLADLETVNRLTRTHQPTLAWLEAATMGWAQGAAISVLDVACGHGDLLRAVHGWAMRRKFVPVLSGIDMNPESAVAAAAVTPAEMAIGWVTGDVFAYEPSPVPDFIVSSQFTHHLDDDQVVAFLGWMERHAGRGWFIADLHRHALAYYGFPWLARLMRFHRIVRIDGTISISRSFRRAEWLAYIAAAGVPASVHWRLAFRYCVSRLRSEVPA